MALKNLAIEEMVPVTGAWVDPQNDAHGVLTGIPSLHGLLPRIEVAHGGLLALGLDEDPRAEELAAVSSEVDALHDTLARGVHGYLTEVALLVDDGAPLLNLRDGLMPEGLARVIRNSYRGQAGFAAMLRGRLPQFEAQLRALPLPGNTHLLHAVQRWLDAGDRLGKLEEEKARLEAERPTLAGQIHAARNDWIRVANAVLANAALESLDEDHERILFGPLRDAEAKAELRSARRKAGEVVPDESGEQTAPPAGQESTSAVSEEAAPSA